MGEAPETFYIFEALGLNFWRFLRQICKQIGCKLTVFKYFTVNFFIVTLFTKIITLLRTFYLKISKFF